MDITTDIYSFIWYAIIPDIQSDTVWFHSHVLQWQAVGRRCCGRQDIDIHLLKPAQFSPDPQYVVPQSLHDNVVQDNAHVPGHDYITYAYSTAHPVWRWLVSNESVNVLMADPRHDAIRSTLKAIISVTWTHRYNWYNIIPGIIPDIIPDLLPDIMPDITSKLYIYFLVFFLYIMSFFCIFLNVIITT